MCLGQFQEIPEALAAMKLNLNKNTKTRLNYLIGGAISVILFFVIYQQTKNQLSRIHLDTFFNATDYVFLYLAIALMPLNIALETYKWKWLAGSAQPISFLQSLKSYLAGLSISIITPNRIGEYPGRILFLKRKNTGRLISVTFLGMFTQFLTLFIFGSVALVYYNIAFPGYWQKIVLVASLIVTLFVTLVFFRFETLDTWFERLPFMKKFNQYNRLISHFTLRQQWGILGISLARFSVYTAQYLFLLAWMDIQLPILDGFFTASLFFWAMAIIPSISLAELGIRSQVSLFLFQTFTTNQIGILAATIVLWLINLVVPAVVGSLLLIKMRILK